MIGKKKYSGITVPVLTPVLEGETVDEAGYRALIRYCLQNGVQGTQVLHTQVTKRTSDACIPWDRVKSIDGW